MTTVPVAIRAMNTRFEIVLQGDDPIALRAAGEAALGEIERLEAQLSVFIPTSEIAQVNRHGAEAPVRVSPPVFRLIEQAQRLCRETGGAFDPTVAPLLRAWGFLGSQGALASAAAVDAARGCVGMQWVELDAADFTVRFARPGMMLDLGAVGKGYAIDRAAEALREAGVERAFLHGGTSSCYAIGQPADADAWRTDINDPRSTDSSPRPPLATVALRDESLGVSGIAGKAFIAGGRTYGHVIDPRTGQPVQDALAAAVVLPSAAESDALSTALITLGVDGMAVLGRIRPQSGRLVLEAPAGEEPGRLHTAGPPFRS